ncbi:translation initiation factor IF-1A [Streptococcus oralis]|uniref:Translation initiation factor IF-1A n=2 Tax=Streptococcus oralis TaxID=1303 RepID=A0A428FR27_STROR|nr:SHIRT domain-containing protein [Streptococcus oralis]RSJ65090.1 translation initiation factor IF-1A [Streptococcus oralis]
MFFQDRKIKYSIRKLSVATVSLAIGFLFAPAALGVAQVAQADELATTEQVENKAENQVSVGSSATEQAEPQKESQVALKSSESAVAETSEAIASTGFRNAQPATGTAQATPVNASLNKSTLENYLKNLRSKDFSSKTDDSLEILNGVMTAADGVLQTATKQEEIDKVYRNLVTFVNSGLRDKNPKVIPDKDKTPRSALYEFESATPGKTVPFGMNYLKPEDTKIYKKGDKVEAIQPTETTYIENDGSGRWTFKGYDYDSQVIDKDDVFFTGKWEYTPTPYKATYRAVNGSPGKTPPAYVANWSPEDKRRFAEGEVVKPQEFHYVFYTSEEYPNRKSYWALTGFDAPSKVANNGDVEFVGTWKYFEDVIVSYKAMNEFDFDNFYKLPSSPKTSYYDKYNLPLPKEIKDLESKLYDYKLSLNQFDKRYEHLPKDLIDSIVALKGYDEVQNVYKPFYDAEHEGNWTHEEDAIDLTYSRELERAATYGELPKVTMPLMFKFTPVPRKPTYEFISGTAGKALPAEINNLKPVYAPSEWKYMDRKTYPKGKDIVQSVKPLNNSYYDAANGGTWNFSGYDFDKKPVSDWEHDGWNLKFTGTWTFTPGTYPGNYKFVSKDPSLSLPEEITTYIPSTGENYSNGDTVLAKAPLKTTYMDFVNKGTWKFEGYDANNKVVNQDKVLFTGTWSFTPYRDKTVSFDFVSDTPGKTIPDDLKAQIPAPITTSPSDYSANVYNEIQYLSSYVDNENDGTWVPQQIPQRKEDVEKPADDEDSTYTVHWKFEPTKHSVYYDFYTDSKDSSGNLIYPPSTLFNLITYEREFVKGEKARVKMPSKTRIEDPDGRGTWVFDDYYEDDNTTISPRVKTVGTGDVIFRGRWILVPTDQSDTIYRLEYKFTNSTPAYPLPNKIRDMLPAGTDFVARADDYKDASKLDTSTVTVPTGTWTFHGFDADKYGKAIAGTKVKTITGSWSFTPNGIDYQFQSTNPDFVLPDHITKLTPKNPYDYKLYPKEILAEQPSETTYVDTANKVTWTFAGYDKEKIVVAEGRQTFLGSWVPTPNPEYVFKSSKAGVPLPQSILGMLPNDEASYKVGDTIVAKQPAVESVVDEEKDYVWTFKGYDQKNATYNGKRVTFTGIWEVTPRPHHVSYTFESVTSGVDLPEFIQKKAPKDGSTYFNGTRVFAEEPTTKTYKDDVNDGNWTFAGYDAKSKIVRKADLTFTGKWTFEANKYQATYRFESETAGKALPAGIATLLPSDSARYVNGASVSAQQPSQTTYTDAVNDGTWTFKGYDAASAVVNKSDVEFVGKWSFEANKYQLTYRFESETAGKSLPAAIAALTPSDSATYVNGASVSAQQPAQTTYTDTVNDGTWTFKGYDVTSAVVNKANVEFVGKWAFEANKYQATYRFESATAGKALPAAITALTPSDSATYVNGASVSAQQPSQTTYTDTVNDGTWTFKGYDAASAVVNKSDVEFVGTWTFEANKYQATYRFESETAGKALPAAIVALTPSDSATYVNGVSVSAQQPAQTTYTDAVNDGTWTFKGYDAANAVVNKSNVEFVGKWTFEANKYQATYRFESETAGKALPAAIVALTPSDSATYVNGVSVSAQQPAQTTYTDAVNDGTWTFKGYDAANAVVNKSNVEFVGKWSFEANKYQATYRFESETAGKSLPAAITALTPSDSATYVNGASVSAQQPSQTTYTDAVNDGTWTFKGYDAASAVVNKSDVEFVGKWSFEANKYQATYRFESATSGKSLPAAIAALTPSDSATYVNGASVSAQQPSQTTYTDAVNDGTWIFKGYDAANAVVNKANVEFVGKWTFEANKYQATYRFESEIAGQALPAAIAALTPSDSATYVNGDSVSAQQPSQTTYTDAVNDGTWTFKGYDAANAVVNKANVEFVGKWTFEANKYQASYRFESETAGKTLPAAIAALTPSDSATYVNGASVSAQQPSQTTYTDTVNDGTWTFKGYDAANAVVNKANVEFVGKWSFEANKYQASYRFESETAGQALPAAIAALTPSDSATYVNGASVSAQQPSQTTYTDAVNDGTWTFKGYDAASAVVNKANVVFVGKWEFKANPTNAEIYTPQVTEETIKVGQTLDLTDNVTNLSSLPAGTKVVDITPAGQIDTTKSGTYTGKVRVDYPDGSSTEVPVPVNVLPAPVTETYKVTYRFESATADNNLPAEVLSLLPQSGTYTTSSSAAIAFVPEAPMPVEVAVANGTWTFLGYQEVEEGANLTFVGKWGFEAKQDPSPQPQPAPQPNPVPPVNPGEEQGSDNNQADRHQPEQPRKPEENPPVQSPAGEKVKQATLPNTGSTAPLSLIGLMTSSLLAGLGGLLLGRKRKDD